MVELKILHSYLMILLVMGLQGATKIMDMEEVCNGTNNQTNLVSPSTHFGWMPSLCNWIKQLLENRDLVLARFHFHGTKMSFSDSEWEKNSRSYVCQ
ncbi:unnamed protein product [Lactuca virosa]|uniref:Uncharacterized protein n=1 Tax=Lactuca virosa TaxID=75947 RepID=A0AAU9P0A6_9ASTR|nr:unnamed protein product [Lactuca virosa]